MRKCKIRPKSRLRAFPQRTDLVPQDFTQPHEQRRGWQRQMRRQSSFGQLQFLLHSLSHDRENAQVVHLCKPQGWLRRTPTDNFVDECK